MEFIAQNIAFLSVIVLLVMLMVSLFVQDYWKHQAVSAADHLAAARNELAALLETIDTPESQRADFLRELDEQIKSGQLQPAVKTS